jgi:hypothetical protein
MERKLTCAQAIVVVLAIISVLPVAWFRRGGGPAFWASLFVTVILSMTSVAIQVLSIRAEVRRTGNAWYATACFGGPVVFTAGAVFWLALLFAALTAATAIPLRITEMQWFAIFVTPALIAMLAARVALRERLRRAGRLPTALEPWSFWSERQFGRPWLAELGLTLLVTLSILLVPNDRASVVLAGGSVGLLLASIRLLYIYVACERGWAWPDQANWEAAAARKRQVENLPGFATLRARNRWIDAGDALAFMAGFVVIFLVFRFGFNLIGPKDPRGFWLVGLIFGLVGTMPPLFISLFVLVATLPRGRARLVEYFEYAQVSSAPGTWRVMKWLVGVCSVITVVTMCGFAISIMQGRH